MVRRTAIFARDVEVVRVRSTGESDRGTRRTALTREEGPPARVSKGTNLLLP